MPSFSSTFRLAALVACLTLAVAACDSDVVYSDSIAVDEAGWRLDDWQRFSIDIADTQAVYDLFLDLRVCRSYPYSNAFLFLTTTFPDGGMAADTLECPLAYPDGQWRGKESGRYVDNRYYFKQHVIFPQAGTYNIAVAHGMRDTAMTGIKNIGLILKRAH